ncbi:MAG: hypothetical protein A2511_00850 [Deltaproteobacteria bacterium RIFOXYD12_FULL_50_9]|nr:MAG: hypothetical protein A2511_00850 [Deltaproteobacteria bacterium RIFOXYD12_FULL_50_9]
MALPWYTLKEVAQKLNLTVDELWRYWENGELQICVLLKHAKVSLWEQVSHKDDKHVSFTSKWTMDVYINGTYQLKFAPKEWHEVTAGNESQLSHIIEICQKDSKASYLEPIESDFEPTVNQATTFRFNLADPSHNFCPIITHEEKKRLRQALLAEATGQEERSFENNRTAKDVLAKVASKLKKVEKDMDVIAARLRFEHGAKDWQLVEVLNIAPHLTKENSENPKQSRNKAAMRSVKKGKKILEGREKSK